MADVKPESSFIGRLALASLMVASAVRGEVLDFEGVDTAASPPGWIFAKTNGGEEPRWEVVSDPSSPARDKVLAQTSDDRTSGRFALAVYAPAEMADGRIAVTFKPIAGEIDQAAGLVWRYRDENNYYIVRANALEDNVVVYKVEDGRRRPLSPIGRGDDYGVKHTVPTQSWSTLGVTFEGSRFVVSFDGETLFEVDDATFTGSGRVGLWTKADSVTYFDAFELIPSR